LPLDFVGYGGYSAVMHGINYITNEKGKRTGVVIDLSKHGDLWEDFYDAWMIEQRKEDQRIPWEKAKKMLRKSRKL
jgi:hypothetical protein